MKNLNTGKAISNHEGLLVYEDSNTAVGYLFVTQEHGTYDPDGRIEGVDEKTAKAHNALLDAALIKGLDETCNVGQGQLFYIKPAKVCTWIGTVISDRVWTKGPRTVCFQRGDKVFEGRLPKNDSESCVFFKRVL